MHTSKLIRLLKKLEEKEHQRFRHFLDSPYFIRYDALKEFGIYVLSFFPAYKDGRLEKQEVFQALFPGQPFLEQKINDLMSYLMTALLDFLGTDALLEDAFLIRLNRLRRLRELEEDKEFQRQSRQIRTKLDTLPDNARRQNYLSMLAEEEDLFAIGNEAKDNPENLQAQSQALDAGYLAGKLKIACEMVNRSHILSVQFNEPLPTELLNWISRMGPAHLPPAAELYTLVYRMLTEPDNENYFRDLLSKLETAGQSIAEKELRVLYDYAQNYCIRKINTGRADYNASLLHIYRQLLSNGLIFQDSHLSQWDYKNIVSTALRNQEADWARQFIMEYKESIHPAHRQNAYLYNLASFHFETGDYSRALRLIRDVEFTDNFYTLGARSIVLRAYYTQEEQEALISAASSFRLFLRRNKSISEYHQTLHRNFIKYILRLDTERTKLSQSRKKQVPASLRNLSQELTGQREVAYLGWLNFQLSVVSCQKKADSGEIQMPNGNKQQEPANAGSCCLFTDN